MKFSNITIVLSVFIILISGTAFGTNYTWIGGTSTAWNTSTNWNPNGLPDSLDNVTISGSTPSPILSQNRKVNNLTISTDSLNLGTYTLTFKGTGTFTSGVIYNGTLQGRSSSYAAFNGTKIDCFADIICGYIRLSGSTFQQDAYFEDTGVSTGLGAGGCTFNGNVTIKHTGSSTYFTLANTTGDTFNGNLILINTSTHEINIATSDSSTFNGNIEVNSTNNGGILFGLSGGKSVLASGKTISVGSTGFTNDYLTLKKFTQLGTTAQTLTLTSSGAVNIIDGVFNGGLTVSASGFLLKNNSFLGTSTFTKNGTPNYQSDGGNTFFGATTISNSGSAGRIRMATVTPDNFKNNATFNSTGQDLQVAYSGDNYFEGNITINSIKVVFNTATGRVLFTGTNSQSLNGSYNYAFKKVTLNKNSNHVTANTAFSVDDSLTFINGNFITTSTNLLTMKSTSKAVGASDNSFISGPVKKVGNTAFVFPTGKKNDYRFVEITAPGNVTDAYTGEYFDSTQIISAIMDTTITFISDCGYWELNRNVGTSNIIPKFSIDSTDCDYLSIKPAHIAFYNGIKWIDKGEGVIDGLSRKTNSAVTSYGFFVLAYNLKPGDSPQFPFPITIGNTCSATEIIFDRQSIWFSFNPDSTVIKACFLSPDSLKKYAAIKKTNFYSHYIPRTEMTLLDSSVWAFDSTLTEFQNCRATLQISNQYLLRVDKFTSTDGPGIYDTSLYYVNMCLLNSRMIPQSQVIVYNSALQLFQLLGSVKDPYGTVFPGDILIPGIGIGTLDISADAPLLIESGVTLCGNYDLLSDDFDALATLNSQTVPTSPSGTLITCTNRGEMGLALAQEGYMFYMKPNSTIRNIRLQGVMPGFQDYNFDGELCSAIRIDAETSIPKGPFNILNSEIYNFSYAGIYMDAGSDDVLIDKCYIHHILGSGGSTTTSKGYGIWLQGGLATSPIATNATITNCIFDESKEGIDSQPNPLNTTIESCTFGEYFLNENFTRHRFDEDFFPYLRPLPNTAWTPTANCFYYPDHGLNCGSGAVSINSSHNVIAAAGNTFIDNSIFHQANKFNISIPYPANPVVAASLKPIYNIRINNNTFSEMLATQGDFIDDCGLGGYARIDDIFVSECTWDYERNHNINNQYLNFPFPSLMEPILINEPNAYEYIPGKPISNSTSPQPPEINIEIINVDGYIKGSNKDVPYININDNISIEVNHGILGSQMVSYVLRPQTNNEDPIDDNTSGNNSYNDEQIVTLPQNGPLTYNFSNTQWETSLPGLYGIDVMAVDGNPLSKYYTSQWVHKPIIIAPTTNYTLIFNVKDSWYGDINNIGPINVYKQVELNGHPIWKEKITEGGDGWERIEINLLDEYPLGTEILSYLNTGNILNQLSFSISMPVPSLISTSDLKGITVWFDDIYLKKYDHVQNLIIDGDIEASTNDVGLGTSPEVDCIWYAQNEVVFNTNCFTLNSGNNSDAFSSASITKIERKSGKQALQLHIAGLEPDVCFDYDNITTTFPSSKSLISATVDFDYRDFIGCDDYDLLAFSTPFSGSSPFIIDNPYPSLNNEHVLLDNNIEINAGGSLTINGSQIAISSNSSPYTITVNSGGSLKFSHLNGEPTYIYGCDQMWGGIINNGGLIENNSSSALPTEISDAEIAISSIGGIVNLRYTNFIDNYIGVRLSDGDFFESSTSNDGILGNKFRSKYGLLTKTPHANDQIYAHIQLEKATNASIGGIATAPTTNKNHFSDSKYGIMVKESNVTIINNNFENLFNLENINCSSCGIGILVNGGLVTSDVKIGGINSDEPNQFDNVNIGIFVYNLYHSNLEIIENEFNNTNYIYPNPIHNYSNSAITIQNPAPIPMRMAAPTPNVVEIYGNTIQNNRIGIHAINLDGLNIGTNSAGTLISGNNITFEEESFPLDKYFEGIWLQACSNAKIANNNISNNTSNDDLLFRGIDIERSPDCGINCNTINKIAVAINFWDDCGLSKLRNNTISNFYKGVWLNGPNGAKISIDQGDPDPNPLNNKSWDNIWNWNSLPSLKVDGAFMNGLQIAWYHQGIDNNSNNMSPNPWYGLIIDPKPTTTSAIGLCTTFSAFSSSRYNDFGSIVGDSSVYFENEEKSRYLSMQNSYIAMKMDSTLISRGDSLDTDFENFYFLMDSSNIGKFHAVRELAILYPDSANIINESITDTNDIENNLRTFNTLYLNKIIDTLSFNSSDTTFLENIMLGSWLSEGDVFYNASAILFRENHPQSSSLRVRPLENNSLNSLLKPEFSILKIFPNPTNNKVSIELLIDNDTINLIQLYNSYGNLIFSSQYFENQMEIGLENFNNGIYILRAITEKGHTETRTINLLK